MCGQAHPVGAGYSVVLCDLRIRMEQPTDFGTFRQPEAAIRRWRSAAQAEPGKTILGRNVTSR
jgi:hypothetical protein